MITNIKSTSPYKPYKSLYLPRKERKRVIALFGFILRNALGRNLGY